MLGRAEEETGTGTGNRNRKDGRVSGNATAQVGKGDVLVKANVIAIA